MTVANEINDAWNLKRSDTQIDEYNLADMIDDHSKPLN